MENRLAKYSREEIHVKRNEHAVQNASEIMRNCDHISNSTYIGSDRSIQNKTSITIDRVQTMNTTDSHLY